MAQVMVVDDDVRVREVVVAYLRAGQHDPLEAGDGEQALDLIARQQVDLVVLDRMLPGIDGLQVATQLRATSEVPIIMLTALGAEADRVRGLQLGVDDYLGKPFSPRELMLRVNSVLRRSAPQAPAREIIRDGELVLDETEHSATRNGEPLALTGREFALLRFLITHPGTAFTRDDLLQQVWGWTIGDHSTVTVHVRRLREKIEPDPANPARLLTVWGVGYRWVASP